MPKQQLILESKRQ